MTTAHPCRIGASLAAAFCANSASRPIGSTLGVAVLGTLLATGSRTAILPTLTVADLPPTSLHRAPQSAEATRTLARALRRAVPRRLDLLAAANRAYPHAMDVTALRTAAASLTGPLLVIRCLRSQEPALETSRGHRPASLTNTARRG